MTAEEVKAWLLCGLLEEDEDVKEVVYPNHVTRGEEKAVDQAEKPQQHYPSESTMCVARPRLLLFRSTVGTPSNNHREVISLDEF